MVDRGTFSFVMKADRRPHRARGGGISNAGLILNQKLQGS